MGNDVSVKYVYLTWINIYLVFRQNILITHKSLPRSIGKNIITIFEYKIFLTNINTKLHKEALFHKIET